MRRSINTNTENLALDWLAEQLTDGSISNYCAMTFARQGNLGSRCYIIDLVTEARIRGARLSACVEYLEISPTTIQRWQNQRRNALHALGRFANTLKLTL